MQANMAGLWASGLNFKPIDICGLYFNTTGPLESPRQNRHHYLPQIKLDSHISFTPVCYTTVLKQYLQNTSTETISEAKYCFPLYDGVAVCGYTIKFGNKTLKGVVQEKNKARKTYQDAVDRSVAKEMVRRAKNDLNLNT